MDYKQQHLELVKTLNERLQILQQEIEERQAEAEEIKTILSGPVGQVTVVKAEVKNKGGRPRKVVESPKAEEELAGVQG